MGAGRRRRHRRPRHAAGRARVLQPRGALGAGKLHAAGGVGATALSRDAAAPSAAVAVEAARRRARPPDAGVGRRRLRRVREAPAARMLARARRAEARAARSRQDRRRRSSPPRRARIAAACAGAPIVALDERGQPWTTRELADAACALARRARATSRSSSAAPTAWPPASSAAPLRSSRCRR